MKIIMNEQEMARAIKALANDIVKKNDGAQNVVLIGIMEGGYPLAKRIADVIEKNEKVKVPVGSLDVSLYRDDLRAHAKNIKLKKSDLLFSIEKKIVVLVDDVLFHGRTTRAGLDSVNDYGRPSKIELAVLIDRGNRELPIQPDFCGKTISTSISQEVKVELKEIDGVDRVIVK